MSHSQIGFVESMDSKESVTKYLAARDRFVERMTPVTRQLDEWVARHLDTPPSLTDIAHFEGLRTERTRLLSEFGDSEDRFVLELLDRLATRNDDSAVTN